MFTGKGSIALVYVDDFIIFSRKRSGISDRLINSLANGKENFEFTDEGYLKMYLSVDITKHKDGSIEVTQPHLIERLVVLVDQEQNINIKTNPATKPLFHKDEDSLERKYSWNYRQAISMLTYLQGTSRPDISMATHQAARLCIDPKLSHKRAVHRIGRYLKAT